MHLQSAGLSAGTVRLYFQKLASVLHDAYKNAMFDYRILERVKRPRREQTKKEFLTVAELKRMDKSRTHGENGNIERMFLFSCLTGLRFGDVAGLKWENVKRSGLHLYLDFRQQKTGTAERLPLCADAEEMLLGMGRGKGRMFAEVSNQQANVVLRRWCKSARIKKDITFHSARHTFCVMLLTEGVPIYTVQELMGHADISTTKVYADLAGKAKRKAVSLLPRLMA